MLDANLRARLLQRYPILGSLPASELESLLASATPVRAPAGAILFDEGEACRGFGLLLSGLVRIAKAAPNGRELHLYDVAPGDSCILTSGCILGRSQYSARGTARADVEMVMLTPAAFLRAFTTIEAFRDQIFARFSARMTELLELVSAVAFQRLDQRLASALVNRETPIHTTHQALADELGSLREIVSRLLKNFAEQGWVRLGREQIEIVDAAGLRRLAAGTL
jgi:CRP/FNR family transcriptional regulator